MSNYPNNFDNDTNLYLVKDALSIPLGLDYYPGSQTIIADGDISHFPFTGIITLVDQCSLPQERTVSFRYNKRTNREFLSLELLTTDYFKPKKITMVTMQVRADHREALKDSIISIEKFLGVKHVVDDKPRGNTIFGRLNFLRKIIFAPKAWFEADRTIGIAPFTVNFKFTGSGNTGPVGKVSYVWDFGNNDKLETLEPICEKTFLTEGNQTASLTIKNYYGEDTVVFKDMIKVKEQAPEINIINFVPQIGQLMQTETKIRTKVNQPITIEAEKSNINYIWKLGDDLPHANSNKTKALFSIGGLYDLVLRTETNSGAYKNLIYKNYIDVVESVNLWLWDKSARSYEFGLISEVMKTSNNTLNTNINDSFVKHDREKFEFWRNNGSAKNLLYWASGRNAQDSPLTEKINFAEYDGFTDIYTNKKPISRPWNWASLVNSKNIYFFLGIKDSNPTLSLTNQERTTYDISTGLTTSIEMEYKNYKNSAHELMKNPDVFDTNYNAPNGQFSAYRTTWKNNSGYILRNSKLNNFEFNNFYRTDGTTGLPFQSIVKLPDLPGDNHKDGDLVSLESGIYFFDNYGGTYKFNTGIWELLTPHNRVSKNQLDGLIATSDFVSKAYISIENTGFFKFNELDMSYISLKPINNQWLITIF